MKRRERVFTHPSQLNALAALPVLRTSSLGTLRLRGSFSEHPERTQWEAELNHYYDACGCDASAVGFALALMSGGVWAGYAYVRGITGGGASVGVAFSIALVGAVIGKLIGRFRANEKLKQAVRDIQRGWQLEESLDDDAGFARSTLNPNRSVDHGMVEQRGAMGQERRQEGVALGL